MISVAARSFDLHPGFSSCWPPAHHLAQALLFTLCVECKNMCVSRQSLGTAKSQTYTHTHKHTHTQIQTRKHTLTHDELL